MAVFGRLPSRPVPRNALDNEFFGQRTYRRIDGRYLAISLFVRAFEIASHGDMMIVKRAPTIPCVSDTIYRPLQISLMHLLSYATDPGRGLRCR